VQTAYFILKSDKANRVLNMYFYIAVTVILTFMGMWSHYMALIADPGYLPKQQKRKDTKKESEARQKSHGAMKKDICERCGTDRSLYPRAHHCRQCKRCSYKMDHHCQWSDNCVSYWTKKYYLLFNFYSLVDIIFQSSCMTFCTEYQATMWQEWTA
jgi:ribosomal protein L40E